MVRRIRISKRLLSFVVAVGLLVGCSKEVPKSSTEREVTPQASEDASPRAEKWGDAPDFTLPKLGGGRFTLSSLKGKVIILDFWATWCRPCLVEIPDFISLYHQYQDKGLEIVGVALDKDREAAVRPFAQKMGINYTIVLGDREVTRRYGGIRGIPTTFIIDRSGNVREKHVGVTSKQVFENELRKLF